MSRTVHKAGAYAVIFCAKHGDDDVAAYAKTAAAMIALAQQQDGFLGVDSAGGADGLGITVSYWRDEAAIRGWRQQLDHAAAQQLGKDRWYARYSIHVCEVKRAYAWERQL